MDSEEIKGINVNSAALCINVPLKYWLPKFSYLVCRGLVDNKILPGKAVIGVLRERFYESKDDERPDGFSVRFSNYAWIDSGDKGLFDPCNPENLSESKYIFHTKSFSEYYSPVNPLTMNLSELPKHYLSDEIYPIRRGLHKQVFSWLLGLKVEVSGLTMTEIAYLSELPLKKLGNYDKLLYEFLINNNLSKLIPIKNIEVVFPQMAYSYPSSFRGG